MILSYKDVSMPALDVDPKSRRVKMVISEMGSTDLDNDVITPGAYDRTLAERGPNGKGLIHHLIDHNPSIGGGYLSTFSELNIVGNQLQGVSILPDTTIANDAMKLYDAGLIKQHSVGFQTVKSVAGKGDEPRKLTELKLYEGSAVLWGANPNTPTISVGKGMKAGALAQIREQMMLVANEIKNGKYTDQGFSLLVMYIKQLEDLEEQIDSDETNRAADSNPAPDPAKRKKKLFTEQLFITALSI